MLSHEGVALFKRIERIREYVLVGGRVLGGRLLGFKSPTQAQSFPVLPADQDIALSYCSRASQHAILQDNNKLTL